MLPDQNNFNAAQISGMCFLTGCFQMEPNARWAWCENEACGCLRVKVTGVELIGTGATYLIDREGVVYLEDGMHPTHETRAYAVVNDPRVRF